MSAQLSRLHMDSSWERRLRILGARDNPNKLRDWDTDVLTMLNLFSIRVLHRGVN